MLLQTNSTTYFISLQYYLSLNELQNNENLLATLEDDREGKIIYHWGKVLILYKKILNAMFKISCNSH